MTYSEDAERRYPPPTIEKATAIAKERISEWSYEDDPHGFCHERPVLIAVEAALGETETA